MANKLTSEERQAYAQAFAERLCSTQYRGIKVFTGEMILNACSVKQVNLFVMYHIFSGWKRQMDKARSPYFDYTDAAVLEAQKTYMNVLSRHIAVKEADFRLLLKKAVDESLQLLYSPADFLEKLRDEDSLENRLRYISLHREAAMTLAENPEQTVDEVLKSVSLDDPEPIENDFEEVMPLPHRVEPEETAPPPEEELDFFTQYGLGDLVDKPQRKPEPTKQPEPPRPEPQPEPPRAEAPSPQSPRPEPAQEKPRPRPQERPAAAKPAVPLHERLAGVRNGKALHENLRRRASLRNNISLNQRFMFIQELFGGNQAAYAEALDRLDACQSLEEAEAQLAAYGWNSESEAVQEFMDLLYSRFA